MFANEAYYEFHHETIVDLVPKYERLVVSRSLSKIAAMAGSRIGYVIPQPHVAEQFSLDMYMKAMLLFGRLSAGLRI